MHLPSKRTCADNLPSRSSVAICRDGIRRNTMRALTDREVHQRFLKRIEKDPNTKCWNWVAGTCGSGGPYGLMRFQNKTWKSHRYAFQHYKGPIPKGLIVRHKCDNTRCCNPRHLLVGTQKDNSADMIRRKRARYRPLIGVDNPRTKVTPEQVLRVMELSKAGVQQGNIATMTGTTRTNVGAIIQGRTWSHLTGVEKR